MKYRGSFFFLLFFALFALLGFAREYFFVHLNSIMFGMYYGREGSLPVPASMWWVKQFSYAQLYYMKYGFTLLCTLLYFFLSYSALKILLRRNELLRFLSASYLLLFSVSAIAMLYAYFVKEKLDDDEYTLSRWLMGILQSPLICLLLLASEQLFKANEHDTKRETDL